MNFIFCKVRHPRLCLWLLSAALVIGIMVQSAQTLAQSVELDRDYDLVTDNGLVYYSQTDWRWSSFLAGPYQNYSIEKCGCLLSVLATVLNHEVTGVIPWFPINYVGGFGGAYDFNPRYLDVFLNIGPTGNWPAGWGYKEGLSPDTCGVVPLVMALQSVGTFDGSAPVGVNAVPVTGFEQNVKDIVNQNLIAGRPTIVLVRRRGATKANHAMLIAGWDNTEKTYRYLDPALPSASIYGPTLPQTKLGTLDEEPPNSAEASYDKFEKRIEGIIDIRSGTTEIGPGFLWGDDPSPIEILMIGPDGRRTGFDPETGASFEENDGASYWTFGPWSDPLGEVRVSEAPRFIEFPNAPAGTYHFKVTGLADGPLHLSAETLFGGTRVLVGEFSGTIAAGEVRNYELQFSPTGASTVAQVSNFTPHAYAGDDLQGRTDAAIAFDGRRSFDVDGAIASFAWDFGDGGTGVGSQPQHVYTVPGDFTVTLTVSDADGATATDSLEVNVILSQQRPVADASGPYLGFQSGTVTWDVNFYAGSSSDPNGDPLTYHWDFGDGSSTETTTIPYISHAYTDTGIYTMTLIVNDGIEDSLPATARVEIVEAPSNPPTYSGEAVLTPNCGLPGDTVTIAMGSFSLFGWSWNFGISGDLPSFPPQHLILGLSAPDGQMRINLPGGEPAYVPFQATLLSPARYSARATFTVPDVAPGVYDILWAEDNTLPFQVPCPMLSNRPPVADAGGPYAGGVGSPIEFDGSASSDPDGDALTYEWDFGDGAKAEGVNPTHSFANEGSYLVTLIVSDGQVSSAATIDTRCFARATITAASLDTIPPTTTAISAPPVNGEGWNTTDVTVDLSAVDNPGGSGVQNILFVLSGAQSGTSTVEGDMAQIVITNEGTTEITYFATDNAGNSEAPQHRVVRIDLSGPVITGMPADGCSLWPPNHKLVTVAEVSAMDGGSGMASSGGLVLTATSSEPEDTLGDGSTEPDVVINGGSVALRAERSGTGVGRTYRITATATDLAGNTTHHESVCVVPHDQSAKR